MVTIAVPRPSRRDRRAEAILRVGLAHFLANGFVPTRVEDIARDAGVVKQTIYNRFGGKEGLFNAVLLQTQDQTHAEEQALLDFLGQHHSDPEAALVEAGMRWLRLFLRDDLLRLRRLVMAEAARNPAFRHTWQRGAPQRFRNALSAFLAHQAEAGRLAIADAGRAAEQYIALVGSEGQALATEGEAMDDERLRDIATFQTRTLIAAWRPAQSKADSAS